MCLAATVCSVMTTKWSWWVWLGSPPAMAAIKWLDSIWSNSCRCRMRNQSTEKFVSISMHRRMWERRHSTYTFRQHLMYWWLNKCCWNVFDPKMPQRIPTLMVMTKMLKQNPHFIRCCARNSHKCYCLLYKFATLSFWWSRQMSLTHRIWAYSRHCGWLGIDVVCLKM